MEYSIAQIMQKCYEMIEKKALTQKDYDFIQLYEKDARGAPITRIPIYEVMVGLKAHLFNDVSLLKTSDQIYYYDHFMEYKKQRLKIRF